MGKWSIQYEQTRPTGKKVISKLLHVQNGVLQGDSLSPLLFCICMAPVSHWLNTRLPCYETSFKRGTNRSLKINHLFFVDDLKLFTPKKQDLFDVLQGMENLLGKIGGCMNEQKCGIAHSIHTMVTDSSQATVRNIPIIGDNETYKYLGIEQNMRVCSDSLKDRISKDLLQRAEQIFSSRLTIRQMISAFNCILPAVVRFICTNIIIGRGRFESDVAFFKDLDKKIRGIMAKCKLRFKHQNIYRIYADPEDGGLGLQKFEETYEESIIYTYCYLACSPNLSTSLWFMKSLCKRNKRSIVADFDRVMLHYKLNTMVSLPEGKSGLLIDKVLFEKPTIASRTIVLKMRKIRKESANCLMSKDTISAGCPGLKSMSMITDYSRWNLDRHHTWDWLKRGIICPLVLRNVTAAQENQILFTNHGSDGRDQDCRWGCSNGQTRQAVPETVAHIASNCDQWHATLYVERHNSVARNIYYELCRKYGFMPNHYTRNIDPIRDNEKAKLYWDRPVDDLGLRFNRPDIVCFEKKPGSSNEYSNIWIIEVSVVWYQHLLVKQKLKLDKYGTNSMEITDHPGKNLRGELGKRYNCPVSVVPVVLGVFGEVSTGLEPELTKLQLPTKRTSCLIERLSRSAVIGTHWILKAHLSIRI
jgi:hypothetical protein